MTSKVEGLAARMEAVEQDALFFDDRLADVESTTSLCTMPLYLLKRITGGLCWVVILFCDILSTMAQLVCAACLQTGSRPSGRRWTLAAETGRRLSLIARSLLSPFLRVRITSLWTSPASWQETNCASNGVIL